MMTFTQIKNNCLDVVKRCNNRADLAFLAPTLLTAVEAIDKFWDEYYGIGKPAPKKAPAKKRNRKLARKVH